MAKDNTIPAIAGGAPIRSSHLPYARQWLDERDCEAVLAVLKGDWLTTGPTIERFERKVADYVGARYAVAFANGTAALHGACFAAGIGPGDEVITTPITFVATANAVLYTGGRPVFADVDPQNCNIDAASIEPLITSRTKAILPVDFSGHPVAHDEIRHLAHKHGLIVIEDAAHALGASYHGAKIGALSDMTMFSFHPVKSITTGEGGVITTSNIDYYHKLLQFRSHGITRDPEAWNKQEGPWYYEMQFLGFNYRMTDMQAALGLSQMNKLDDFIARRNEIAGQYNEAFLSLEAVMTPQPLADTVSGWHLYVIRIRTERLTVNRREIFAALRAENIGVNVHYMPVYFHPYYQSLGYRVGTCPAAEQCYEAMITLPLFPAMTYQDAADVIMAVRKVIRYYLKT